MVDVDGAMGAAGLKSRMTVQIHDELIFDVAPGEAEPLMELVVCLMSGVVELLVPLTVDACVCENWGQAKQ